MAPQPVFELVPILGHGSEIIANARVISAAPEALNVAQQLVDWLEKTSASNDPECEYLNGTGWDDLYAIGDASRAALAKARGAS